MMRAPSRNPSYLSFCASVVLPEPSAPTLRIVALRSRVRALAQVEAHRAPRARQRVAEVEAAARADRVRRRRHHRGHLLGGQHVVVARDARALARQVLQEQLELVAERPVQAISP